MMKKYLKPIIEDEEIEIEDICNMSSLNETPYDLSSEEGEGQDL